MTSKCLFHHKPFYVSMTMLWLAKSHKIRDTKQKSSVTLYIFSKRTIIFHSLNLLEIKRKSRKYKGQFHSRIKPGLTCYLFPSALQKVQGFRTESLKADDKSAPVILSAFRSLALMYIFDYLILVTVLPRRRFALSRFCLSSP